jgi:glutamate-1-semialdehyde 2,1-aminomutase
MAIAHSKTLSTGSDIDLALQQARENYIDAHPQSAAAFDLSENYMPGGNTRTVLFHKPFPLRILSGSGCKLTDADGIEYVNMLGEYTAGLFGHNNPVIRKAIDKALDDGINLSGHTVNEIKLAQLVCDRFPSIEKVRFTNSGTEANLLAISTARYVTGRDKVMVFEGGYHGGLLYFRKGGTPINAPFEYVVADYNDTHGTAALIEQYKDDLACIVVEPMQGSAGCIPAARDFLAMLRRTSERTKTVLIFDEVMTSRLSHGGVQEMLDIVPDMTTLGKYIGGGMSFGAFGGSERLMQIFDPRDNNAVPHAGTFNNNALTMAAGVAALRDVLTDSALERLNNRGDKLRSALNRICRQNGSCIQFTGQGSILGLHTTILEIHSVRDLVNCDDRKLELIFLDLLDQGYYIARRGFIALMLSLEQEQLDGFVEAFSKVIHTRSDLLKA